MGSGSRQAHRDRNRKDHPHLRTSLSAGRRAPALRRWQTSNYTIPVDSAPGAGRKLLPRRYRHMAYRVHEFAELAGVTVKALRHYDRLGLLKPARTGSGHRVYADKDLERLEQIVALKFLGLSLGQIRHVVERPSGPLTDALRL